MKQPRNFAEPYKRHLQLSGCFNLRELGGYVTTEGKSISWRTVLRGDSLHKLASESQQAIMEYGVKTILDLRTPSEVNKELYPLSKSPEINYVNIPLLEAKNFPQLRAKKTLLEHNCFMLEERSPQIKQILKAIANNQAAVVIHCAGGKERTGIIIALLLAIANVPEVTIAEDYALSEKYVTPLYKKIQQQAIKEGFDRLLLSPPQIMLDTLSYLNKHYGGINGYLQAIDLDNVTIKRLKTRLIN
ncbi:MAG: tyrosine-protein phosphatase [Xenococcaceae cyanobacterium]